jgi:LDH2 family malate/lactate/ureidoglycolate dehydrogenase
VPNSVESVTLSAEAALTFGAAALQCIGFSQEEAGIIAAHLVDSELCAYPALGLARILTMSEHVRMRDARKPVTIVHETPVSAQIDGGNYVGFYAVYRATEIAIEKARAHGFALVGLHNSWLSGRNAYYLEKIARAGFAGIHLACSPPVVVPHGGRAPALGTNPIAFALPGKPDPVVFDMGTSATNHGDVILAGRLGNLLPEGVAVDASGAATRDPQAALQGGILPFGGAHAHKGYGLSFTVQAMGLLAGAALPRGQVQDFGFLFVVFDPALLMPAAQFERELAELIAHVKATPRQPGVDAIRIPSEQAFRTRAKRRVEGFKLDRRIHERIAAL